MFCADTNSPSIVGSKKCTATVYNNLCAKIDKVEISLKFLLYGFSEDGKAHLYEVDGSERPKCYDAIGFWAIGSGAHAALSSLAFHVDRKELSKFWSTLEEAVYFASEAKFMAESSGLVGREMAILAIHKSTERNAVLLLEEEIAEVKRIWNAEGAPRVPSEIRKKMMAVIESRGYFLKYCGGIVGRKWGK